MAKVKYYAKENSTIGTHYDWRGAGGMTFGM